MAMQQQYDNQAEGLIITIVPELSRRVRIAAAQSNLPVEEYVGRVLDQVVPAETNSVQERSRGLNRAAVEKLLQTREAIRRAHPGQVFEDSSELIHQAHK